MQSEPLLSTPGTVITGIELRKTFQSSLACTEPAANEKKKTQNTDDMN